MSNEHDDLRKGRALALNALDESWTTAVDWYEALAPVERGVVLEHLRDPNRLRHASDETLDACRMLAMIAFTEAGVRLRDRGMLDDQAKE